jgi:hypothetical protein
VPKTTIKSVFMTSIVLAVFACTSTVPNNTNVQNGLENFQDLDKEYVFSTKALTQAYLKRKLNTWLCRNEPVTDCPYGTKLVKEINYARYKHSDLFCEIIREDPGMLNEINAVQNVQDRSAVDTPFSSFINGCNPPALGQFQVNNYTSFNQTYPAVAMDSTGDFVITWTGYGGQDGDENGIFARRYDSSGVPRGTEFQVNTYITGSQSRSAVAMDNTGDFVITWHSPNQDGSGYGVFARRYDSTGSAAGSEFRVNTFTTGVQYYPRVAMDGAGDFVVTWMSSGQDGSGSGIYARRYNALGEAQDIEFRVNTFTTNSQYSPSVAMDSTGDFVISWDSGQDGSNYGVYAQRYHSDGFQNGSEFRVNTYTTSNQSASSAAMDSDGDFVITWFSYGQDGSNWGIYAQKYNAAGNAQGSELQVNTYTTDNQVYPSVAMDNGGDFVITWTSVQYGSYPDAFARRYDSAGSPTGTEFRVNTFSGSQSYPAVAMDSAGDFVITWDSYGLLNDEQSGISAKRFNSSGIFQEN